MRSLAMLLCVILCLLPVLAMGEDSLKSAGADAAPVFFCLPRKKRKAYSTGQESLL